MRRRSANAGGRSVRASVSVSRPPATTLPLTVQVQAPAGTAPAGTHKIYFEVKVVGEPEDVTREVATFIIPE